MFYLIISLLALLVAPFAHHGVMRLGRHYRSLELVLFFAAAGMVVLQLLPESVAKAGYASLAVFVLFWVLPYVGEKVSARYASSVHNVPIFLSLLGVSVHEAMDGFFLAYADLEQSLSHFGSFGLYYHPLPILVVLHRFPAAVFLWWIVEPRFGVRTASFIMAAMGLATVFGFVFGAALLSELHQFAWMGIIEAMAAGSLMHLASHRIQEHDHVHSHGHDHH